VISNYGAGTFGEMRKQTQFKPNSKPNQTQNKANFGRKTRINYESKPNSNPILITFTSLDINVPNSYISFS